MWLQIPRYFRQHCVIIVGQNDSGFGARRFQCSATSIILICNNYAPASLLWSLYQNSKQVNTTPQQSNSTEVGSRSMTTARATNARATMRACDRGSLRMVGL